MRARLAAVLLTLTAASASAETHEISIGPSVRALRTDSANALTEDSLTGGQLGYGYALDLPLLPGVALWATGTFGWASATGTMFQTLDTEVDTLAFTVGGRARYPVLSWLNATARLDLGTARAAVSLRDGMGHTAADAGWGVTAQTAVGLELLMRTKAGLSIGFLVELGYALASPVSLTATPESEDDNTLQLEMSAASLGSLNLSGKVFAASVSGQF